MRFKNLLTILLLFVATLLWAEPITQSTARKKAVNFASKHGKTIAEDVKNLFKVRGKTKAQAMPYYVFNTNDDNGLLLFREMTEQRRSLLTRIKVVLMQMKYQIICANGFVIMPM